MPSDVQSKATAKYIIKKTYIVFRVNFENDTEVEIFKKLKEKENTTEYLKSLNDVARHFATSFYIEQKHHGITIDNPQDNLNLINFKQALAKHHYYHNQMVIFLVELIYSSSQKLLFRGLFPRKKR